MFVCVGELCPNWSLFTHVIKPGDILSLSLISACGSLVGLIRNNDGIGVGLEDGTRVDTVSDLRPELYITSTVS